MHLNEDAPLALKLRTWSRWSLVWAALWTGLAAFAGVTFMGEIQSAQEELPELSDAEIIALTQAGSGHTRFGRLPALDEADFIDSGFVESEERAGAEGKVLRSFYLRPVGEEKLIFVSLKPGVPLTERRAKLRQLNSDEKGMFRALLADEPELRDALLPAMVVAGERPEWIPFAIIIGGFGAVALVFVILWLRTLGGPESHPFVRKLQARFGPESPVELNRDLEDTGGLFRLKKFTLGRRWLLHSKRGKGQALPLPHLVWAHLHQTKHSVNFIPVGSSWALHLYTRGGHKYELECSNEKGAEQTLEEIATRAPWAIYGFNDQLQSLWQQDPGVLAREVDPQLREAGIDPEGLTRAA